MAKLLIIDDEIDLCELIAEVAEAAGVEVRTISDSALVAEMVATYQPDAIMLDLMMPGTDGVELLRTLSAQLGQAKIALMSGSDARVLGAAQRLGAAHGLRIIATLEKPFEISTIRSTVAQLIAKD